MVTGPTGERAPTLFGRVGVGATPATSCVSRGLAAAVGEGAGVNDGGAGAGAVEAPGSTLGVGNSAAFEPPQLAIATAASIVAKRRRAAMVPLVPEHERSTHSPTACSCPAWLRLEQMRRKSPDAVDLGLDAALPPVIDLGSQIAMLVGAR